MNPGQAVFPLAVVLAFIVIATFVASHPAVPFQGDPKLRYLRVEPGDEVVLEVTGYFGGDGHVWMSTQEERWQANEFQGREGKDPPRYQTAALSLQVRPQAASQDGTLEAALLGHRVNRTFTTPQFAAEVSAGVWEHTRTLNRTLEPYPLLVTFDASTRGFQGAFNLTQYVEFYARSGYLLDAGVVYPCEGPERWTCVVVEINASAGSIVYRRNVKTGDQFPAEIGLEGAPVVPRLGGTLTVTLLEKEQLFTLTWLPIVGDRFQLPQDVPGFLPSGSYEVTAVGPTTFTSQYTVNTRAPPHLIGEPVWYDIVVTSIRRPASPP